LTGLYDTSASGVPQHSQILLVTDATVGREQQLEPRLLGGVQERGYGQAGSLEHPGTAHFAWNALNGRTL